MKHDSDEPHKQGSAADGVDFINLRRKWTLASVRFPCLQDDCLAILTKESTSKDFQHLAKAYSVS